MNDKIKNEIVESKCITDENGNYFFGYYDVQPWNKDGNLHLCHKVDFWQRMPKQGEIAEIGIIDVNNNNKYTKLLLLQYRVDSYCIARNCTYMIKLSIELPNH